MRVIKANASLSDCLCVGFHPCVCLSMFAGNHHSFPLLILSTCFSLFLFFFLLLLLYLTPVCRSFVLDYQPIGFDICIGFQILYDLKQTNKTFMFSYAIQAMIPFLDHGIHFDHRIRFSSVVAFEYRL